jgi:CRP/FNR family transcriptional regulator
MLLARTRPDRTPQVDQDDILAVPAFRLLTPAGRKGLTEGARRHRAKAGACLVEKGQAVSGAYFVLSGRLRVATLTGDGKEAALYVIEPGETCILALNSLFNDLLYPAWVHADVPTTVAVVPGPLYRRLFEQEAPVRDLTVRALSTLVFRLMGELEDLHAHRLDQRLAGFLLTRASSTGELHMTQQDIAAHLGTSREVIGRLMARFAAQGILGTRRGTVTLHDAAALRALRRTGTPFLVSPASGPPHPRQG